MTTTEILYLLLMYHAVYLNEVLDVIAFAPKGSLQNLVATLSIAQVGFTECGRT